MGLFKKIFSAMTGAPRLIQHIASGGEIKDFKLFSNQPIKTSYQQQLAGNSVIGGLLTGNQENMNLGNLNIPKVNLGGVSGGISFGGESAKNTWLPFVIVIAIVVIIIAFFRGGKRRK